MGRPDNMSSLTVDGFSASPIFEELARRLKDQPEMVKKIGGIFHFELKGKGGKQSWAVDLKNGSGSISLGKPDKSACTIIMKDAAFVNLMMGKMDGTEAYMSGKLRIRGDMSVAMKLGELGNSGAKL